MKKAAERILGIEGGGTRTSWMLFDFSGEELRLLEEGRLAPANFRLTSHAQIQELWRELPRSVTRVGAFLAGCGTPTDRAELRKLCAEVWPEAVIVTGSDRESGFAAAFGEGDGIAVNAGTGSSITGRCDGRVEYAGGWGHILGDAGGGYYLSLQALRFVLRDYDLHRRSGSLAQEVLRALGLNDLNELVRWAQTAGKMEIATLAPIVFAAGAAGHSEVKDILRAGAHVLAEYTGAVATRLEFHAAPVALLGGLFRGHSIYVKAYRQELAKILPTATVSVAERPPALGAAWLALGRTPALTPSADKPLAEIATAATEQINERSLDLERLSPRELVDLFVAEEEFVQDALRSAAEPLANGITLVAASLKNSGRFFYVGRRHV